MQTTTIAQSSHSLYKEVTRVNQTLAKIKSPSLVIQKRDYYIVILNFKRGKIFVLTRPRTPVDDDLRQV